MSKCVVVFQPSLKSVEVEVGTILMDVAHLAGVEVPFPCGGQGRCGGCKVRVEHGSVDQPHTVYLSPEELKEGYVQACQARITGDAVIFVQPKTRVERAVSDERTRVEIRLPFQGDWQGKSNIRKVLLDLAPPSLADQTSDVERVKRELAARHGIEDVTLDLSVLRKLSRSLRQADWTVTAVVDLVPCGLGDHASPRLIDVLPGDCRGTSLGVAVDIGTTTNVVYLVDLLSGDVIDAATAYNGQIP